MPRTILAPALVFLSELGRPPWRRSEIDVGTYLGRTYGPDWDDQVDFLQGRPLLVGADKIGSTRPEFYHAGLCVAVEVKNWPIDRLAQYAEYLRRQMAQRRWSCPPDTDHWLFFDLRGQQVGSLADLASWLDQMLDGHQISCDQVHFLLDDQVVRAL